MEQRPESLGDLHQILSRDGQGTLEKMERLLLIADISGEDAGKIVAHVEIVWIDQHRAIDPFAGPFDLAEDRISTRDYAKRSAVARVLL